MMETMVRELSELEARVLGVLVEKERTVPDTYPLTLNALTAGCNQKTSREPVMDAAAGKVQAAIDSLRRADLVFETSGGRVMRYSQNLGRVLQLSSEKVALIVTLMLRGPQTAAELRMNCERLHRFADVSSIEAYLQELAARPAGALVALLPRQPGARESRWAHLLCGASAVGQGLGGAVDRTVPGSVADGFAAGAGGGPSTADRSVGGAAWVEHAGTGAQGAQTAQAAGGDAAALAARLTRVEDDLAALRRVVERLTAELGLPSQAP